MTMFDTIIRFIFSKAVSDKTHFYIHHEVKVYIIEKINTLHRFLSETFSGPFVEFVSALYVLLNFLYISIFSVK